MYKPYTAQSIARCLIKKFSEMGKPITSMKLQKLLYFAWAEYFKEIRKVLFSDPIYAWKFGPVVKSVYHEYKIFAALPIRNYKDKEPDETIDDRTDSFLTEFAKRYQDHTASDLVFSTHKEGTPWSDAYTEGEKNRIISKSRISEFECRLDDLPFSKKILSSGMRMKDEAKIIKFCSRYDISADVIVNKYEKIKREIPEAEVDLSISYDEYDEFIIMNIRRKNYDEEFVRKIIDLSELDEKHIIVMSDLEMI